MIRSHSLAAMLVLMTGCPNDPPASNDTWEIVQDGLPGALLSVWGNDSQDVWAVGADSLDGLGPTVLHYDGERWERVATGQTAGNLWWVHGFPDGPIFMGGEGGLILRYEAGTFTVMDTPSTETVFGLWGATPDDMWAVGGNSSAAGGFAWRRQGEMWVQEATLPPDTSTTGAIWKVAGTSSDDAWLVGSNGISLHWDGSALEQRDTGVGSSLFTVDANDERFIAVGGGASGIIVEYDGQAWTSVEPDVPAPGLSGVAVGEDDFAIAVGSFGAVYARSDTGWQAEDLGFNLGLTLHGTWIDEKGGVWAVGGQVYTPPYNQGALLHRGAPISSEGL